jgi:hypothetical protein
MLGDADPLMATLARRALALAIGAPACAALAYLLAYSRSRTLMIEAEAAAPASHAKFLHWFARTPREEAIFQFLALTLTRSRTHRLAILAWSGAAIGILLHAVLLLGSTFGGPVNLHRVLQFVALYWPLGLSTILLFGIRHAYSIPSELPANWLFQSTEREGRRDWMRAVERFTYFFVLLPVYALIAPLGIGVMGWAIGLRMTALQLMVSFATFDILFYSWQKLPFTCSYTPGRRPPVIVLAGWIAVLGALVPVLSIIIAAASQIPEIFAIYGAFLLAVALWLRHRRRAGWGEASLLYEDPPDDLADLGIRELRPFSIPAQPVPPC